MPKKLELEYVKKEVAKFGYTCLNERISGAQSPLLLVCPEKHHYKGTWNNFQQGERCRPCSYISRGLAQRKEHKEIDGVMRRHCYNCDGYKPLDKFGIDRNKRDGLNPFCKSCVNFLSLDWALKNPSIKKLTQKRNALSHKYKLSLADYYNLLQKQDGACCICHSMSSGITGREDLLVDHCHSTGKIRGLLCHHCNSVLGYSKDSITILEKAIWYLKDQEEA